ncbi:adenosylmethionine--8-amino-7-oxononanoate transaminase [Candidatus Odyssella acanthamoebae]|uniref:adenosylmethionine--8-amino-7-oxononanoate transaminase n=1 Tax=Candidatus Odyssella acanthamoebae TaxID=91604 RepID=UPI001E564912|nr:adenosylmethionine--8-amino-7-oxononanoate transaminase [Candidatus Paracaedibacter acanthamoebae]
MWHPFTQHYTADDPIVITHARGASLFDENAKEYLDLVSSWWVNIHGHAHPYIAQAIAKQANQLEHVMFAGFTHEPAIKLAEALLAIAPAYDKVFFTDNGSTAIEVALKIAYQYWHNQGQNRPRFVAFEGAYHGDTFGAMAVGKTSGYYDPFFDLLQEVTFLPFPATWLEDTTVEEKEAAALIALDLYLEEHANETAALILEPMIQGASGMAMCRPSFVEAVFKRCKTAGVLTIADEIMTGFGRTGKMIACDYLNGVYPDFLCLSKGITGGFLPLAVTLCRDRIYNAFLDETYAKALTHGHSYTANPLACAAALASLDVFEQEQTHQKIAALCQMHQEWAPRLLANPDIERVRHQGTILAFNLKNFNPGQTKKFKSLVIEAGLNIRPLGATVYILPPYCLTAEQLHSAYVRIIDCISQSK